MLPTATSSRPSGIKTLVYLLSLFSAMSWPSSAWSHGKPSAVAEIAIDDTAHMAANTRPEHRTEARPHGNDIRLSALALRAAGIEVARVEAYRHQAEVRGLAEVVDLQALLDLRARHRSAQSDEAMARAALSASTREYERSRLLFSRGAGASQRQVHEAQARLQMDRARLDAALQAQRSLRETTLQQWGQELMGMALAAQSNSFLHFVDRSEVLLLATFDEQLQEPGPAPEFFVSRNGDRATAHKVTRGWPAPVTSSVSQGVSFYLASPTGSLRLGMRLPVWLRTDSAAIEGFIIRSSAVVWHAGSPWAYVQTAPDRLQRRLLVNPVAASGGWLVTGGFTAADQVVIHGAQLLLSEELRQQIPTEED